MLVFSTPTIDQKKLDFLVKSNFFNIAFFQKVWESYLLIAKAQDRVVGIPEFRTQLDEINVVGIRYNSEMSFNLPGETYYNDILIINKRSLDNKNFWAFQVTMDPKGKINKIAHILEGVYASYKANRPHRWQPGRTAIVQDKDKIKIARTKTDGSVEIKDSKGFFGINIHDSSKYQNSSIGCTVLAPDSESTKFHFKDVFKPLIKSILNKESIDYMVINHEVLIDILNQLNNPIKVFGDLTIKNDIGFLLNNQPII